MIRSARSRRPLVLVTLVCFVAACHKWVPLESPVEQALAEQPGKVRITDAAGATLVFDTTWVARDSVFGVTDGDTIPVALSGVVEAEQRKANVPGTVGLVVGGAAVACGILALLCVTSVVCELSTP